MNKVSIKAIEQAIVRAKPKEQRRLLAKLLRLLHIDPEDIAWTKLAEPSFEFWNNEQDAIYDQL